MTSTLTLRRSPSSGRLVLAGSLAFAFAGLAAAGYALLRDGAAAPAGPTVSQANRTFTPDHMELAAGGTLTVVNDDGAVVHHAYVDAAGFRYDSGDQEPGDRAAIAFGVPGTFQVLCGIHPRMILTVRVTADATTSP